MTSVAGENNVAAAMHPHPHHHPPSDIVVAYAAGALHEAASLVMATHLALCPACRAAVAAAETIGGVLLDDIAPEPLSDGAASLALARLDMPDTKPFVLDSPAKTDPTPGIRLPQPLHEYIAKAGQDLQWRWVSPGVRYAGLMTDEVGAKVGLLRAAAGATITPHGHTGEELSLVLSGGYRDGSFNFRRGDMQVAGEDTVHELVADTDGECLSLIMVEGPIKPTRLMARTVRRFTSF